MAIKNVGGNSVHSAISNRTESEHTLPAIGGTKASESGDTGVGVKSVSSYLRKGSTQISLESPANALIGNAANAVIFSGLHMEQLGIIWVMFQVLWIRNQGSL